MKKTIKWIGILVGMVLLLAIFLVISLATFVNPNRFKPLLAEKIKHYTGRQLIIDSDLSWTIFPAIGVKTGHIVLKNPEGFDQGIFAEVKDLTVSIKLMPLLHKKIESNGIKLNGLKLHLIKNSQGKVNWNFQEKNTKTSSASPSEVHAKPSLLMVAILGLNISNSEVTWTDEQNKQSINATFTGDVMADMAKQTGEGKFVIHELVANHVKVTNVTVPMRYQQGVLSLKPISASFYQGKWDGDIHIDLHTAMPQIAITANLNHFNVAALMQDLSHDQKLTLAGYGNIDMKVTTLGDGKQAMLKNLNGQGHFSFDKGVLQGIDINYLISSARARLTKKDNAISNTHQTNFNELKGSFVIHGGVVSNHDLVMSSTDFATKGQGTMDLVNQTIDYHLRTSLNQNGLAIPIRLAGSLKTPQIGLDADMLTKQIAKQQIEKVKTQLQERIEKGKIPEKAGKFLQKLLGSH